MTKVVLLAKEVGMSQDFDLTREDIEDLVRRIKEYKDFLSSKDFSEAGKKSVLDEMFTSVLLLNNEIKKLQHEVFELKRTIERL